MEGCKQGGWDFLCGVVLSGDVPVIVRYLKKTKKNIFFEGRKENVQRLVKKKILACGETAFGESLRFNIESRNATSEKGLA